jgi:hypothetical protein
MFTGFKTIVDKIQVKNCWLTVELVLAGGRGWVGVWID